ncbi:hypothetical protein [Enhygromyxa salina]|uniref:Uncharacterized protein n=1 Tax=Enhygromyxa salina TaxID=215803 RepID=A0A2S9Y3I0_9BACT|nr:hypothetical protein [Enhygromyxa salina]PRP99621.1 hypothetical protein ENSA7_62610 [Enhygromyxa salina]
MTTAGRVRARPAQLHALAGELSTDISELHDVAVFPAGYGVAVGEHRADGLDADLWIHEFSL